MKIKKIVSIDGRGLVGHVCPLCGRTLTSAPDTEMLPEFAICDCDRNDAKEQAYELYREGGHVMIRRTRPPRFTGRVTMGEMSDIEDIRWQDDAPLMQRAAALRKAGEFLINASHHD